MLITAPTALRRRIDSQKDNEKNAKHLCTAQGRTQREEARSAQEGRSQGRPDDGTRRSETEGQEGDARNFEALNRDGYVEK
jgi:hypothetical protein